MPRRRRSRGGVGWVWGVGQRAKVNALQLCSEAASEEVASSFLPSKRRRLREGHLRLEIESATEKATEQYAMNEFSSHVLLKDSIYIHVLPWYAAALQPTALSQA
jgi:hypothetical protein